MKYSQKLFIYQRNEMAVLVLLAMSLIAFAFTLGIHMGKGVSRTLTTNLPTAPALVEGMAQPEINREELSDPGKDAIQVLDDSLNKKIREEISRTGIKIHPARPTDLPRTPKSRNAGETNEE